MNETLITSFSSLAQFAEELGRERVICVDLEADSMHNYQEKTCLLQFSTLERTVLVDPLAVPDLSPLIPIMANVAIRKVFHAADYDIRCLSRDHHLVVHGLFDTMISCQILGEPKVGLADVLDKYLGVKLDKKFQRADWSKRPLNEAMIHYAMEDTRHLFSLMEILEKKLLEKGRLAWAAEEFFLLEQVRHAPQEGPLFLRFKGAWKLRPRQLAVLEGLLQWRDRQAQRQNRPHFMVIGNKPILELVYAARRTSPSLQGISGMPQRLVERYGEELLSVFAEALALPEEALPAFPQKERPVKDPVAETRLKALKHWRVEKATALEMDPGVVINGAALETISRKSPEGLEELGVVTGVKSWQFQEFGTEILEILRRTDKQA